jgi:OmcA/MtrC family decaheme c-type cytochrome
MTMQRRQRTHGLLGTAAAAVLLAMTLGLAGCGSDGDDGADGRDGQDGQDGRDAITVTDAAFGVDSPNASLCYSCHQNRDDQNLVRAHIDALGGEMFGFSTHLDFTGPEGCTTCHGGLRPGAGLDGLSDLEIVAGVEHQARRPVTVNGAEVDAVRVDPTTGQIELEFTITGSDVEEINAEFTIAKWVPEKGAWINLLQRAVGGDPAAGEALVIRGGNLRQEDTRIVTGGIVDPVGGGQGRYGPIPTSTFTYTFLSDRNDGWGSADDFTGTSTALDGPLNFVNSPLWRVEAEADPATYCAGDTACITFVDGLMTEINTDGEWDLAGTYRVGVTGRNREAQTGIPFVRFAAVADVTLDGSGGFDGAPADPAPTNQIAQASCNTCHGDRLAFPRNNVHGGQRPAVAVCNTCHNPYTYDADASTPTANGWASISANVMVHKIHAGIEGYTVDGREYESVVFPDFTLAGNSNCASCHKGEPGSGFGDGWNLPAGNTAVATACATCHGTGGVPVAVGIHAAEVGGRTGNCAQCHDGSLAAGYQQTPDAYHGVSARLEELRIQREEFAFSLVSVSDAVYEGTPVVQWQVLDGAGVPYNLSSDISIDGGPRLHIGWGYRDDWTNEGSGEKSSFGQRQNDDNGRPVALNVATTGDNANTVISADGLTAISTFPRLTDAEAGQGRPYADLAAAEDGRRGFVAIHNRVSDNGAIRQITSLVQPIILGSGVVDLEEPPRRNTIDATFDVETADKRGSGCLDCHGTITAHGGGYIMDGNVQACITCHNAGSHESRNVAALNDREPRSVDFMFLMHQIHSADRDEILYPQDVSTRCHACHAGESDGSDGNVNGFMNGGQRNCDLCHSGVVNPGRLGVLSNWPGANSRYGLRGDGTDGE